MSDASESNGCSLEDVAWSCVVDDTPAIWSSLLPWIATLIDLAGLPGDRIHVHHVCPLGAEFDTLVRRLGIRTHPRQVFDPRFPHCNKLRQIGTDFADASHVVLTDVDTAVASTPPLGALRAPVAGKLVDLPNPSFDVLERVFTKAGLALPNALAHEYWDDSGVRCTFETFPANFNGGMYVVEAQRLGQVGAAWEKWARWLIDHEGLLGRWSMHVDQVAFCMAVNDLGLEADHLADSWNYPLHLHLTTTRDPHVPHVLHHHARLDDDHYILASHLPHVDEAVTRVNQVVKAFRRRHGV